MMMFDEFVKNYRIGKIVKDSKTARKIYNDVMWDDSYRIKMVLAAMNNKPSIIPVIERIEYYCNLPDSDLKLDPNDKSIFDTTKQYFGLMVLEVMRCFGFEKDRQKNLPKEYLGTFTSGSVYKQTDFNPEEYLEIKIRKRNEV